MTPLWDNSYAYWANKENRKEHEPPMVVPQLVFCKKEQNQGLQVSFIMTFIPAIEDIYCLSMMANDITRNRRVDI